MGTIVNKTTLQHFGEKFLENLDGRFVAQETGKGLSSNDFTAEEKTKLREIEAGADENIIESITVNGTIVTPENKTVAITIPIVPSNISAFTNDAGYITSSDIPEGAAAASTTSPLMDGTAVVGTEMAFARGDHRHPTDTSRQAVISDLDTIRSGAAAGATAVQPSALNNYATTTAVSDAISAALASVYKFRGTKATYSELPANAVNGDVWNVTAAYGEYPAGTNFAWVTNTNSWDALGGSFTIDYMTSGDVNDVIDDIFS